MARVKEPLSRFVGKLIEIEARWDRFGSYPDPQTRRPVVTACVKEVYVEGELLLEHCWIQGGFGFQKYQPAKGEMIMCKVRVRKRPKYVQTPTGLVRAEDIYNLENPSEIRFPEREDPNVS